MPARAVTEDFLHSMRFHVTLTDGSVPSADRLGPPEAGFSMCSVPEPTVEAVEYKEGTYIYTRKQPGNVTFADISMSRGVAISDTAFWHWLKVVIEGSGNYRENVMIKHFHREEILTSDSFTANLTALSPTIAAARTYTVFEAFPIRHKIAADLDATASEISIMELDLTYEYFNVTINSPT